MTTRLILARHGNTFGPEDRPVWVGARSDLPLVEKGVAQAHAVAEALVRSAISPHLILTGPLQRTRQTADIVAETLGIAASGVVVDHRLCEIDYGAWEGKSTEEIIAMGGGEELEEWNKKGVFPLTPGWKPHDLQILADILVYLSQLPQGTFLTVSSNGILRYFARAAANAGEFPERKVATGNMCVMERDNGGEWRIREWNRAPDEFR